jgi:hypothetical protein
MNKLKTHSITASKIRIVFTQLAGTVSTTCVPPVDEQCTREFQYSGSNYFGMGTNILSFSAFLSRRKSPGKRRVIAEVYNLQQNETRTKRTMRFLPQ